MWAPPAVSSVSAQPSVVAEDPRRRRRGVRGSGVPGPIGEVAAAVSGTRPGVAVDVAEQLAALVAQIAALSNEVRELRNENAQLRRQLEAARGPPQPQPYQHQPYTVPSALRPLTPLCPLPSPSFSSVPPSPGDTVMDTSTLVSRGREGGHTPEAKRPSGAARTLLMVDSAAAPPLATGSSAMDMDSTSGPLVPDLQQVRPEAPTDHVF